MQAVDDGVDRVRFAFDLDKVPVGQFVQHHFAAIQQVGGAVFLVDEIGRVPQFAEDGLHRVEVAHQGSELHGLHAGDGERRHHAVDVHAAQCEQYRRCDAAERDELQHVDR